MKPSRTTRLLAAVIAVISLLFTQMALASYVCPNAAPSDGRTAQAPAADMSGMENCPAMGMGKVTDKARPSLCHSHGNVGKQSLDKPNLPQVQPFVPTGPALVVISLDVAMPAAPPVDTSFLAHATAPPLAIRHCCFRI